jgi:hypothetical protein
MNKGLFGKGYKPVFMGSGLGAARRPGMTILSLKSRFCHSEMRCCATLRNFSGTRLKSTTSMVKTVGASSERRAAV